jgi:hypothetical protein
MKRKGLLKLQTQMVERRKTNENLQRYPLSLLGKHLLRL